MDALANALGAPLTFAEQLGLEPTSDVITFTVACKIVARMDPPNSMSRPLVLGCAPGKTKFIDLPLKDFEENKTVTHAVESIIGWEPPLPNEAEIQAIVKAGDEYNLMKLPLPLRPKKDAIVPFKMDVCIILEGGKASIFKHYVFNKPGMPTTLLKDMAHGNLHLVDFGRAFKYGPSAFLVLWSQLGGTQICNFSWKNEAKPKKTVHDVDQGYDLIRELAVLPKRNNMQNRAIMKAMNDDKCILSKWSKGDIKEGIASIRDEAITATVETEYPICFYDQPVWWQHVKEEHVIPFLLTNSKLMLGLAGTAKTPDNYVDSFAVSRYQGGLKGLDSKLKGNLKWVGEVRSAGNMDFFRLESGRVECPDIFDDGDLNKQDPAKTKMFFDPSMKSAKTKERWGAAEFVRNQMRSAADNKLDFSAYPSEVNYAFNNFKVPHNSFLEMIQPAFPEKTPIGDVEAILKRAVMILVLKDCVLVRPPSANHDAPIHRYVHTGMFLTPEGDKILTTWLKTGKSPRPESEYQELLAQEKKLYKTILDKVKFSDEELKAIVKQEEEDDFFARIKEWQVELAGQPVWITEDGVQTQAPVQVSINELSPDAKRRRTFFAKAKWWSSRLQGVAEEIEDSPVRDAGFDQENVDLLDPTSGDEEDAMIEELLEQE